MTIDYSKLPTAWSRIVIDGDPGAGKTTLAKEMSEALGAKMISFDDHLPGDVEHRRPYVEKLNYDALQSAISAKDTRVVIEGVLALKILDRIGVKYDYLIFLKRFDGFLGWRFGEYLKAGVKPPKDPFWREIVQYYREWKPFDRCDVEGSRDICEQP